MKTKQPCGIIVAFGLGGIATIIICIAGILFRAAFTPIDMKQHYYVRSIGGTFEQIILIWPQSELRPRSRSPLTEWKDVEDALVRESERYRGETQAHAVTPWGIFMKHLHGTTMGRSKCLPSVIQRGEMPLLWFLLSTPYNVSRENSGKHMVIFWDGSMRYMTLPELYAHFDNLKRDHPESPIEVLDIWDKSGNPIWREIGSTVVSSEF